MRDSVIIPGPKVYDEMLEVLEEIGYTITDKILDLCQQIDTELDKQDLEETA